MFHTYILVTACLPLVSASIYPTQPVQATVWSADQPMLVSWIENWEYPRLSEMGSLDILLWRDTDTYLAQLASGVDPMAKTRQVTVPGWALKQGSKYTLRFTTKTPFDSLVVYSADFAIVPANMTTGSAAGAGTGLSTTQSGASVGAITGSGSRAAPTSTGVSSTGITTTANQSGSTTSLGVPQPSGTIPGGASQRVTNAGRRGVDVEKLKFQFTFVIWPVLMGVTMAL